MKRIIIVQVMMVMLSGFTISAFAACTPRAGTMIAESESGQYSVSYSLISNQIRVGELFSLRVVVCDQQGTIADVNFSMDAWMPQHNHGMNYHPKITKKSMGHFLVEGLMMHMPGMWQFTFKVKEGDSVTRFTSDYILKK